MVEEITARYKRLRPFLDEKQRRIYVAVEAEVIGYGGISAVSLATGISRNTIVAGLEELRQNAPKWDNGTQGKGRIRKPGGGA